MTRTLFAIAIVLATGLAHAQAIAWTRGLWFDGRDFVRETRWSVDGVFVERKPSHIERIEDLGNRHVVPAYGDAHHHGIDSDDGLDDKITVFLEAGIFYVKNPNVIPDLLTPEVRRKLNRPDSIDVVFANGGLTSTGGHPAPLHEYLSSLGVFRGLGPAEMDNRAYFIIDDAAQLDAKWPRILAGKPDFIKTFVLFSDPHGRPMPRQSGSGVHKGLDPRLLSLIVQRAHAGGLRVSSHIDTVADFRHAVEAGVDEINHLPQPDQRFSPDLSAYVIDPALARLTAEKGITVVTTASTTERLSPNMPPAWLPAMRANQAANLRTLRNAGVKLAIGSDAISGERRFVTAREEVRFLHEHGLLGPLDLLRAWAVETPKTIFPKRRIGELREGFEANFLVLAGNPLESPAYLHRIVMRVKQGRVLPAMPELTLGR